MTTDAGVFVGRGEEPQRLLLSRANRHGLVAGATGTGKTVTLQILAEGFSAAGVPVFMADVKGDLSGISQAGSHAHKLHEGLVQRAASIGLEGYGYRAFPTVFWDLPGQRGHPVRTTVSDMGPLLLARLLDLNDTQEGVLNIALRAADDNGMLLLDFKDLRAMMRFVGENARELSAACGNVSKASVGAIQRRLLVLEEQGVRRFFGEPALELEDMIRCDANGYGQINLLAADRLMQSPRLYSTFLLWLLSELFEELPEVGDPDKPVLVFFFDEAHLLFEDAPRARATRTRLARSWRGCPRRGPSSRASSRPRGAGWTKAGWWISTEARTWCWIVTATCATSTASACSSTRTCCTRWPRSTRRWRRASRFR